MTRLFPLLALLALAACNRDPAPGGATAAEAQALDDAAEMIDEKRLPDSALRAPAEAAAVSEAPAK